MQSLRRSMRCMRWCGDEDEEREPVVAAVDVVNEQPRIDDQRIADRLEKLEHAIERSDTRINNLLLEVVDNREEINYLREIIKLSYSSNYKTEEQEEAEATISVNVTGMPEQEDQASFQGLSIIEMQNHTMNIHPDQCFKMDHKNRGKCLVFYHDNYKDKLAPARDGAGIELDAVQNTFGKLGFELDVHKNKTYKQIKKVLEKLKNKDFSKDDCISIIVMSHGGDNDMIWAYDNEYPEEIFEKTLSKIDQLTEKPKLILFQACRGHKIDKGIQLRGSYSKFSDKVDGFNGSIQPRQYPSGAEFYIVQSALPGYRSWRNWFLPTLCGVLDEYSDVEDIHLILRRTNELIAKKESSCKDANFDKAKQILVICHNLTKTLFLKSKQSS